MKRKGGRTRMNVENRMGGKCVWGGGLGRRETGERGLNREKRLQKTGANSPSRA